MTDRNPSVEIIIPHYKGFSILERCFESLTQTRYPAMDICVVDNCSGEGAAIDGLKYRFGRLRVVSLQKNMGYAGGCNSALFSSSADYVVFMNDDAVVEPFWLQPLVRVAESDSGIAALQPKILSLQAQESGKKVFDYAGGAGGMIDRLGYPYCYGRTFYGIESDHGQYDRTRDIFWASGVAMFARRKTISDLGGFDEDYFMHMEEIDLCWRLRLRGYRIVSVPESIVYHEGGVSLAAGNPEKIYMNHRNNIAMLLKNMGWPVLVWAVPLRIVLEFAAAVYYLLRGEARLRSAWNVFRAFGSNLRGLGGTVRKRRVVQVNRTVSDSVLFRDSPFSVFFSASSDESL